MWLWVLWNLATKTELVWRGSIFSSREHHLDSSLAESQCRPPLPFLIPINFFSIVNKICFRFLSPQQPLLTTTAAKKLINLELSIWKTAINRSSLSSVKFYIAQCFSKETFSWWPPSGITHRGKLALCKRSAGPPITFLRKMKDLFQQTQEGSQTRGVFIALSHLGVRVWKY